MDPRQIARLITEDPNIPGFMYNPVQADDRTNKFEVLEGDDLVSVDDLAKEGFKEHTATVMNDNSVFYILISENGVKKWFPIRYD